MKRLSYKPSSVIFQEGEKSSEVYRILRGRVEISIEGNQKSVVLAQLGEGDIFGEMAMVDETLWLRIRFEAASAALKRGGVFAVHKTRAAREGLSARTASYWAETRSDSTSETRTDKHTI